MPSAMTFTQQSVLFHFVSKFCTSFEFNYLLSRNGNLSLSSRVDACTFALFNYRESTESDKSYLIILSH